MGVMVLVGIASLGGLFMVAFLVAISHKGARPAPAAAESLLILASKPVARPHLVRSATPKTVTMTRTLKTPVVVTPGSSVRRRSADARPQQRIQAR
jgi:hypothetical protein